MPNIKIERVALDDGGYDESGAYWGLGKPLFYWYDDGGALDGYTRANDYTEAAEIGRKELEKSHASS